MLRLPHLLSLGPEPQMIVSVEFFKFFEQIRALLDRHDMQHCVIDRLRQRQIPFVDDHLETLLGVAPRDGLRQTLQLLLLGHL